MKKRFTKKINSASKILLASIIFATTGFIGIAIASYYPGETLHPECSPGDLNCGVSITTTTLTEGTNLYYTQTRFDDSFLLKDTDDLLEGSTNKYYTDALVNTNANVIENTAKISSYWDTSTVGWKTIALTE